MEQKNVLSTQETIRLLGISRTYLYKLMDKGDISPLPQESNAQFPKLNFDRAEVEALKIERNKKQNLRKRRTPSIGNRHFATAS